MLIKQGIKGDEHISIIQKILHVCNIILSMVNLIELPVFKC